MPDPTDNAMRPAWKKPVGLAIMFLPTAGLLLALLSWIVPSLNVSYSIGIGIFLFGWVTWALTMPFMTPDRQTYVKQFIFFLVFFPVMYPFILALVPWGIKLARQTEEIQRGIADGSIRIEIPPQTPLGQDEP